MGSNESSLKGNSSPTAMRPSTKKKSPRDVGCPSSSSTIRLEDLGLEDFEAPPPIIMPMFLPTKNIGRNWQFWTLRSRSLQKAYWKHCTLFNFEFYTRFGFGELLYKRVSDTEAEFDTSVFFKLMIVEKVEPIFSTTAGSKSAVKQRHRLVINGKTFQTAECKDMTKMKPIKLIAENGLAKVCETIVAEGDMLCVFGDINIEGADTVFLNNRFQHPVHVAHVKFGEFEQFDVKEEWYESMRPVCRDFVLVQEFMAHREGEQAYHCQPLADFNETDTSEIDTGGRFNILEESDNIINGSLEEEVGSPSKISREKIGKVSAKSGTTALRESPEPEYMTMETSNTDPPSPPEIIFDPNLDGEFDKRKRNDESEEKENLPARRARSHHGNYKDLSDDEPVSKTKRNKNKSELPQKPTVVEEITLSEDDTSPDMEDETNAGKSNKSGNLEDSDSGSSEATVIVPRSKSLPVTTKQLASAQLKQKQKKTNPKKTQKKTPKKPKVDDSSSSSTDKESGIASKSKQVNSLAASKPVHHQKPPSNRSASVASKKSLEGDESDDGSSDSGTAYFEKVAARLMKNTPLKEPSKKASRSPGASENKSGRPKRACTQDDVLIISTDNESKSSSIPQKISKKKPAQIDDESSESENETPKDKREPTPGTAYFEKVAAKLMKNKPLKEPSKKASRSPGASENKSGRPKRACTEDDVLIISTDNESKSSSIPQKISKKKPARIDDDSSESEHEIPPKDEREQEIHKYLKSLELQVPNRQPCPQVDLGGRSAFKIKNLPPLPRVSVSIEELPEDVDDYLHAKLFQ